MVPITPAWISDALAHVCADTLARRTISAHLGRRISTLIHINHVSYPCSTHIVKGLARCTVGDDLESGVLALYAHVLGDGQLGKAEVALASDVQDIRCERDVEVRNLLLAIAKPQIDEEIRPGMVQVDRDSTPGQRPLGSVFIVDRYASAYFRIGSKAPSVSKYDRLLAAAKAADGIRSLVEGS